MRHAPRNEFYVYGLFRDDGRIFYIGKGQGRRWLGHAVEARAGKPGYRFNVIRDMQSRNVEMPMVKIHEGLTEIIAHKCEIALIAAIGRYPHGPLVNLTDGGEGITGLKHTPQMRAKMSAERLGKKPTQETREKLSNAMRGRSFSVSHRNSLSLARIGIKYSPEVRANMSAGQRGKKFSEKARANMAAAQFGRKHTPETLEKMSKAQRARHTKPPTVDNAP